MKQTAHRLGRLTWVLLVAGVLSACGNKDPQELVVAARQYIQKNDYPAAIIELKNALQAQPDLAEARLLLGKAMLANGDAVGAEAELRKAREVNYSPNEVSPLLARAWLALGQPKKVTEAFDQTKLDSPQAQAELLTSLAVAWRMQNRGEDHRKRLKEALAISPELAAAVIEHARQLAGDRAFDQALIELDELLGREPRNADALKLRGDVLQLGLQKSDEALQSYQAAVAASPKHLDAHVALVRLLMATGKNEDAVNALRALVGFAPGHPSTLYLQTQEAYQKQDMKTAKERVQQLLKVVPDSPNANEIAGAIELQTGSVVQAQAYLSKALKIAPGLRVARRALVAAHLRAGQLDQAVAALPGDLKGPAGDADPEMLSVAGRVYMAKGEFETAQGFFKRATRADPKNPGKRTSLAVSQFMSGQTDLALNELAAIASQDEGIVADMALINAHMQRKEYAKALAAISALESKRSTDPMPRHLKGVVLSMQNDRARARTAFEDALKLDPSYLASVAGLASLDLAERKPDAAVQRVDALTKQSPENPSAWLALADVLQSTGATKEKVGAAIDQAVKLAPQDIRARVMLIEHYLRQKEAKAALASAQAAAAAIPDAPEVVAGLGQAQAQAGESLQAIATFNKLVTLMPGSPMPYLLMASTQIASKDNAAAMQSVSKALSVQPDFLPAQRAMAELAVASRQIDKALSVSKDMQKQRPNQPLGYVLEGDVHAAFKQWEPSATAYRNSLKISPLPEAAVKLHSVLTAAGKQAEADRWAEEWNKSQPKDVAMSIFLGDRAIAAGHVSEATRHYERVVALQPTNALALNNLAWLAGEQGRADAISIAEKANQAAPNQPAFMDTWAMLLSAKGEHAKALELQSKVVELKPETPLFKLNLAKIQIKAGNKDAARRILEELAAMGDKYPDQAEVVKLKQAL
ncbi:MAG: XrtA/PEP-CTERM system TPR-repeat protein PrsT [Hydrogenophaga sp.]|uniref:XrtA/PEP-CTERM system TPR-repeat protein PrsT n=1 Tax=Hydrogenophaga sp. TaxID=1904254 RepID=UPI003D9BE18D